MKLCLPRPARTSAAALFTAVSVLGVAGCSVFSPATVLKPYSPSDGTGGTVGGVQVRNVLVVSAGVDEPGVVSLVLVNGSETDQAVAVSADVDAAQAPNQSYFVPAGRSVQIGDDAAVSETEEPTGANAEGGVPPLTGWLQIPQVPVIPGKTVPMTFRVSGETLQVDAPVVLPCFEYSTISPTAGPDGTVDTPSVTCDPEVDDEVGFQDEDEDAA